MRYLTVILVLLAGCATTTEADVATARSSWDGASYDDVVRSWGTPVRTTRLSDGRDAYTWLSESVSSRGAIYPSIGIFGASGGGGGGVGFGTGVAMGGGGGDLVRCERALIFQNGKVVEQNWQGSSDYCVGFRRG
jgi:hypothetical protein